MTLRTMLFAALAGSCLAAGAVAAQEDPTDMPPAVPPPPPTVVQPQGPTVIEPEGPVYVQPRSEVQATPPPQQQARQPERKRARFSPYLVSFAVGAGASDFVRDSYRSRTGTAAAWDARLTIGTRTPLALEIGYVGTAQEIHDPFGPDPTLASNSLEGNLRFNLTIWRIQPFLLGGVGWLNYHSYGRDKAPTAQAEFNHDANSVVVPMGGGLAAYIGKHGMIDARFTYRLVPNKDLTPDLTQRPDNWTALLRAGYAF